jgi:hypothetical protein
VVLQASPLLFRDNIRVGDFISYPICRKRGSVRYAIVHEWYFEVCNACLRMGGWENGRPGSRGCATDLMFVLPVPRRMPRRSTDVPLQLQTQDLRHIII